MKSKGNLLTDLKMLPKKEGAFIAVKYKFFFYIIINKITINMKIFVHIDMIK